MKLIDVSVPLRADLPTCPGNTPVDYLAVDEYKKESLTLRKTEAGLYEMFGLPLSIVGADGAPARVMPQRI